MKELPIIAQIIFGLLLGTLLSLAVLIGVTYGAEARTSSGHATYHCNLAFSASNMTIVRLTDMNDKGETVGNDFAGDGFFINKKDTVTEIRCPGDQTDNHSTTVSAINNRGQIVGSCTDGAFVRDRNGKITILNFPGAANTVAYGINDLGDVVGQYGNSPFTDLTGLARFHGFIWRDGVYTTIDADFPDAIHTTLLGINNAGQVIGTYLHRREGSNDINDYDREVAFLYDNGNFIPLEFPGAQLPFLCCGATTFPMDINNLGQVIGSTYNSDGKPQFFLKDDGEYFVITGVSENVIDPYDFSIVHGASAWGINDNSEIAGTYTQRVPCDACGLHGEPGFRLETHSFVATPKKVRAKHKQVN